MRKITASLTAVLAMAVSSGSALAEDLRLVPSADSNWTVNYRDDRCRLLRSYGEGDQRSVVIFDQFQPGRLVVATIAGEPLERYNHDTVRYRLSNVWSDWESIEPAPASLGEYGPALLMDLEFAPIDELESNQASDEANYEVEGLPAFDFDLAASIDGIELARAGNSLFIELPGLAGALQAMNTCMQDFVDAWGLDLNSHRTMSRMAQPINFDEIAEQISRKYPREALNHREQGQINVRIIVDADGSIEECAIDDITSAQYLKSNACDEFGDRAMFAPAQDAEGTPMKSYYAVRVIYQLGR